ncbi:MAG: FtsX-like permease family protein, partial [Verrucomicrobiota bacterium]|nr:FtsX-like permease family protein [Verrucomicrobiota bacterium]
MSLFSKGESSLRNTIRKDQTDRDLNEALGTGANSAIFPRSTGRLSSVGIYGVMNYSATQRTQEIGIRLALGAKSGDILRLIVGHGMKLTLAGIVIGVIASLALTRVMANRLFGVTAADLPTFHAVSALLTTVALVANYIP